MRKIIVFFALCFLTANYSFSQSKSQIKELNISTKKTYYIDYEDSNGDEQLESVEKFNEKGLLIEEINYDKSGKIKKHEKYEYNSKGKLTKEIRLLPNGKKKKTIEYKYNDDGLKIMKIVYDSKDIIISKKRYDYTFK